MNNNNRTKKGLTTLIVLTMATTIGFGQGMLVEGAARILETVLGNFKEAETTVSFAGYEQAEKAGMIEMNFERLSGMVEQEIENSVNNEVDVIMSFNVNNVEVSFENALETEAWMTESFTNKIETTVTVESWMTESFSNELEAEVEVENWMTESLSNELEAEMTVESWMTESFSNELEAEVEVENWMTESLSNELEAEVEVENWMTESFSNELEAEVEVENWMTRPLVNGTQNTLNEEPLMVEDWMTATMVK